MLIKKSKYYKYNINTTAGSYTVSYTKKTVFKKTAKKRLSSIQLV